MAQRDGADNAISVGGACAELLAEICGGLIADRRDQLLTQLLPIGGTNTLLLISVLPR